jgi:hypothetical protein
MTLPPECKGKIEWCGTTIIEVIDSSQICSVFVGATLNFLSQDVYVCDISFMVSHLIS